jgi:hypothetical protein
MNNIENNFVPYQIALDMKSIGFDEPCFTFYPKEGKMGFDGKYHSIKEGYKNSTVNAIWIKRYKKDFECVAAPTYSQAFRWFREKYKYNHSIVFTQHPFGTDEYQYMILLDDDEYVEINFKTYEEAELACLKKLIEIIKEK